MVNWKELKIFWRGPVAEQDIIKREGMELINVVYIFQQFARINNFKKKVVNIKMFFLWALFF